MLEAQALFLPLRVSYFWGAGADCFHFKDALFKIRKLSDGTHLESYLTRNTIPTVSSEVKEVPQLHGKCGTVSALDLWVLSVDSNLWA